MSGRSRFQTSFALSESKLQAALQFLQLLDFLLDRRQLLIKKFFYVGAGRYMFGAKDQELANLAQREAQFLSLADKFEPLDVAATEQAKAAIATRRSPQQPLLFVKADRVNAEPGLLRNLPDLGRLVHCFFLLPCLEYNLESTPESSTKLAVLNAGRKSL